MKIRRDFVTNSSSSSFLVAFHDKNDLEKNFERMSHTYEEEVANTLIEDIKQNPSTEKEAIEFVQETAECMAYYELCFGRRCSGRPFSYWNTDDGKKEIQKEAAKIAAPILEKLSHNKIFAIVSYEDHSSLGSLMEYDIMPKEDSVLMIQNNH